MQACRAVGGLVLWRAHRLARTGWLGVVNDIMARPLPLDRCLFSTKCANSCREVLDLGLGNLGAPLLVHAVVSDSVVNPIGDTDV